MGSIVQDDEQDWLRESAHMRHIYSNSYFTIAADEPASCNLGFLGEQGYGKADWQRSFYVNLGQSHNGEVTAKMFVRPNPAPHHFQKDRGEIESSALEQRGWTVQESILPLRMLHFTGNKNAWECNQTMLC